MQKNENLEGNDLASRISQREFIDNKLKEFNLKASIDTFRTTMTIYWKLHNPNPTGYRGDCIFDRTTGDMFNLGNGNWLYVGNCYGVNSYAGKTYPITFTCSMEYDKLTDCIKWDIGDQKQTFCNISTTNATVQFKSDVSGNPQIIIVRTYTNFGFHYIENGSYTTFKN